MLRCSDQALLCYRDRVRPKSVEPSLEVSVKPYSGNAYGKDVSELQTGVSVGANDISGTLHYVTGYTGFHGSDPTEQEGNYLALDFTPSNWDGILTVELVGGTKGPVTLTSSDHFCVFKIDATTQTIKVEYTDGDDDYTKSYSLTNLVLEEE